PRTLISIPLSPSHVFFGSDAPNIISHISSLPARDVVRASNISTLTTAKKFAYGSAEPNFVEQHLHLASL
ncbi:hypothetical protein Q0M92_14215, partial [Staphylococcus aureus]|nr:hypothetical protein [Staphylococcus aureus]